MKDEALKIYCAMLAAGQQQGTQLMADAMDQAEKFNLEFDSRMEKVRCPAPVAVKPRPLRCVNCFGSGWVTGGIIRSKKVKCSECDGVGFLP